MIKAAPLVVALASDRLAMFEFGITAEFFALQRPELDFVPYRFAVAAADPLPLRGLGGIRLECDGGLELLRQADLIVVPGWRDLDETPPLAVMQALRDAAARGARIASICSGAFLIAHSGLLDGKRATTHWRHTDRFARQFPHIRIAPDVLYVDEGNVITSAGSAAGIDMLLHLVRKDYGPHVANNFARRMVVPPHRDGGQSQFVVQPIAVRTNDRIASVADWMAGNLSEDITIEMLADRAAMSVRTFTRRFRAATGTAPIEWLIRLRVRRAQDLLETTDVPIDTIAHDAGFGAPETLRHHFRKVVGTSPSAWRATFRGKAAAKELFRPLAPSQVSPFNEAGRQFVEA
jgi:AraC family transcriptional activator FtrA